MMGSTIYLRVGRLEIDWGKNSGFADHNALFQPSDLGEVPYYYAEERAGSERNKSTADAEDGADNRWHLVTELQEGYTKALPLVVDRLEMLGHTDAYAREEFSTLARLNGFDEALFTYDDLATALREVDVTAVSPAYCEGSEDLGDFFRREIHPRLPFGRTSARSDRMGHAVAEAMENLSPYTVLRLLADNPTARDLPVVWAFADVVDGGWVQRSDVVHPLVPHERFSILTEGSSDAEILKKALALLDPHIEDFFSFIEMVHPFSGTGQVINLVKGLVAIGVHNNVLVLFDNDAEGCAAWQRCTAIGLPDNLRALKLPDLPEFEHVDIDGPAGRSAADINGRAAAIECYLDLGDAPNFRWSNYNRQIDAFQGELINKEAYMRGFLSQKEPVARYDYGKIRQVLSLLKRTAREMNEAKKIACLGKERPQEDD